MPRKCPCGKISSFNVPGEKNPICCSGCKTEDMIDVRNKKCPCGKRPKFNVSGERPICCVKCKTEEMIDVVSKKCPCGKQSKFNIVGETSGVCCSKCKTNEMIDVVSRKCPCGKHPNFNVPGEKNGVCCKDCKTGDMINVKHNMCLCGKQPKFNIAGETSGVCCKDCKTDEMIDVMSKKCPCGRRPSFNLPGEEPTCCSKCKASDMIIVTAKICQGYERPCPVRTYIGNGHKYCMSCDPNDARRKRYKRFEETFFEYIKDKIDVHEREFHVTYDPNETSKKFARIDGIVFGNSTIVCLEVDENEHRDYECDEHRMHLVSAELLQRYPDRVVSWVRVNPTVDAKSQWSKKSKEIREKRFEDVVNIVNDLLEVRETTVKYIGFKYGKFQ